MRIVAVIYTLIALACCGWVAYIFGVALAFFLGLIVVWPAVFYVEISRRDRTPKHREFAYLAVVSLIVLTAVPFLISVWFDAGLDLRHAWYREFVETRQLVESQPRFKNVEVKFSPKSSIYFHGSVESQADHDSLIELIEVALKQDASGLGVDVKVVGGTAD